MNQKAVVIAIIAGVLVLGGLAAALLLAGEDPTKMKANLVLWNVFDDSDVFAPLIKEFNQTYKGIKIEYYKKPVSSYENDLVNALAAGRGPDIFAVNNTWLPKHQDKLAPVPDTTMTVKQFQDTFVDVAAKDFIASPPQKSSGVGVNQTPLPEQIYAMPLFVDTLALFWNKDIFNSAGVSQPPADWLAFQKLVDKLRKKDENGNIVQAAACFGSASNVNRASDILSLLMLQAGSPMIDEQKGVATFDQTVTYNEENYTPGVSSLNFYTSFANPTTANYTWNNKMDYSIDAFAEGRAAMMINYAYQIPTIEAKDSHLRFAIAPMPQPQSAQKIVNFANYWGLGVSASASDTNQKAAWVFVKWLTEKDQAQKYLASAKRPAARRDLVEWQSSDTELGVFAEQALSAKSWHQADSAKIETIFNDMINSVLTRQRTVGEALQQGASQVTLLMQK